MQAAAPISDLTQPDWCRRSVPVFAGLFDTHIKTGADYDTTTLAAIFTMPPGSAAKGAGSAIVPSSYCGHDAREHATQREHGCFVALCGDVDTGNHQMATIEWLVNELAPASAWLIYSSAHARPGDMRWRIIIPLEQPLPFHDWYDAQCAFFDAMECGGVNMDWALTRAAQPVFLPNVPNIHPKSNERLRGDDGEPLFYARSTSGCMAPGISAESGALASGIAAIRRQREADDRAREMMRRQAEQRRANRPRSDGTSVIDAFNDANPVGTLLEHYGYEQSPRHSADWRSRYQTGETFATRIIDSKWVSLSASDASAGLGEKCQSGCFGDSYDLFVHYEHGGDHRAAFRALHSEQSQPSRSASSQFQGDGAQESSARSDDEAQSSAAEGPRKAAERPQIGVRLNDFHAYMPAHNYIFAPSGEPWPSASVNSRIPPIPLTDSRGEPVLDKKGEPIEIPANKWLDQNRPVEQMTWAPGEPQVVKDRLISDGGWIQRPKCNVFNLYRPPAKHIGDGSKAGPWLDHINRIYPDEARHMIHWLAHRVQRPQEKINHAIVLGGTQGIGKDTILEPVKAGIGPWNFSEVRPEHLLGRFNSFVKSVILRVSEARDLGDMDRFAFYDHMKIYTAAPPDVLRVDEKNVREYAVFNVCGVIITTNHKTDGIYLPADDRRHYVAWSNSVREEFDEQYWSDLYGWYDEGGTGHVVEYLSTLCLDSFNPKAPPPKTPAFWDIVSSNQAPEEAELADALDTLGWPHAITISMIASSASEEFSAWLSDRRNSRSIPHKLDRAGYVAVRNDDAKDGLFRVGLRRCAIYAKRELDRRDALVAAQNLAAGRR